MTLFDIAIDGTNFHTALNFYGFHIDFDLEVCDIEFPILLTGQSFISYHLIEKRESYFHLMIFSFSNPNANSMRIFLTMWYLFSHLLLIISGKRASLTL